MAYYNSNVNNSDESLGRGDRNYELLSSYKLDSNMEYLTSNISKSEGLGWIGHTNYPDHKINGVNFTNLWDKELGTSIQPMDSGAFASDNTRGLPYSIAIKGTYPNHVGCAYKVVRKTVDDERYRLQYNFSGSGAVVIMASTGSGNLTPEKISANVYRPPVTDNKGVKLIYSQSFTGFNPTLKRVSQIDDKLGNKLFDTSSYMPGYPAHSGSAIIKADFNVPKNNFFAIYLMSEGTNVTQSYFSNVSMRRFRYAPSLMGCRFLLIHLSICELAFIGKGR